MTIIDRTASEDKQISESIEKSNSNSFASISQNNLYKTTFASSNLTRSSSPGQVIHSVSYSFRLNFFGVILVGVGLYFLVSRLFMNRDSSSLQNNHFDSNKAKSFTQSMVATPQL